MVVALTILALAGDAPVVRIPAELEAVAIKMRGIKSLQVSMRQIKTMSVFNEKLKSSGTLSFSRPRRLRMDLTGPGGTILVIDGDVMGIHYKALNKTEFFTLSRDPRAKAIAAHLFLLLDADPLELSKSYGFQIISTKPVLIRLTPKSPTLKRFIRHIDCRFDARGFVDELLLYESNDDTTRWTFADPVLNVDIPDKFFKLSN